MDNIEKKNGTELNEKELEKVAGGDTWILMDFQCSKCGYKTTIGKHYLIEGNEHCPLCRDWSLECISWKEGNYWEN